MTRFVFPLFFLFTAAAYGADFFVDSQQGDDSRVGTSIRTAWKSLEKVNEAKLVPGDRVQFRTDGVWNGVLKVQSGSPEKPIVYTSFGRGKKPSIRNAVSLAHAEYWTNIGDDFWVTKTEIIRESKTSRTTAGARWETMQMGGSKTKFENFTQDGLRGIRVTCIEPGESFSHREMNLKPLKIESGRQYVFRFKARASIPFVMTEKSVRLMQAVAPYDVYGAPLKPPGKIEMQWNEYVLVFNNKKNANDARITIATGGMVPKRCVFEFLPISFVEVETESLGLGAGVVNLVFNGKEAGVRKTDRQLLRAQGDYFFDAAKGQVHLLSKRAPWLAYPRLEAVLRSVAGIELSGESHVVLDGIDVRYTGGHGIQGSGIRDIVIRNCDISWTGGGPTVPERGLESRAGNGIELYGGAENVSIENCRVGEVFGTGIALVGTEKHRKKSILVRENTVWNCDCSLGVFPETRVEGLAIKDNVFHGAGRGWSQQQGNRPGRRHILLEKISDDSKMLALDGNRFSDAAGPLVIFGCDVDEAFPSQFFIFYENCRICRNFIDLVHRLK